MKFTEYFNFTRQRSDRADIRMEWIELTFSNPDHQETQTDGRIRRWAFIEEAKKYLRVIVLEDGETIHNAFFDSSFKPNNRQS